MCDLLNTHLIFLQKAVIDKNNLKFHYWEFPQLKDGRNLSFRFQKVKGDPSSPEEQRPNSP